MGSRGGFSEEENIALRLAWGDPTKTLQAIQEEIGRSRSGVQGQAKRLGLGMKAHVKFNPQGRCWDETSEAELRRLAAQDLSWRAVAKLMGVSKNTVLGKAKRLGLHKVDARPVKIKKSTALKIQNVGPNKGETARPHVSPSAAFLPLPDSQPRPWIEREFGQCRWPVGGEGADLLMCCRTAPADRYCTDHHAMAFSPRNAIPKPFLYKPHRRAA